MINDIKLASDRRQEEVFNDDIDKRIDLLLANYQRVTANPRSMGYLRFLLRHYGRMDHPWRRCYADNFKRFGEKTAALCGVLKDTLRQTTYWRGKAGHSKVPDAGAPGAAIGEADKGAAPPWGGHHHLSDTSLDMGSEMAMPEEIALIFEDISNQCDPYRVIVGLEEAPVPSKELEGLLL